MKIPGFTVFQSHIYRRFQSDARHPSRLRRSRDGQRPKFRNHPQNAGEDVAQHRDLCHLEANVARMTDDLGADLDQLFAQHRHRSILDLLRRRPSAQEVQSPENVDLAGDRLGLGPILGPDGPLSAPDQPFD